MKKPDQVLKATWLSRRPHPWSLVMAALGTLLLVLGSVIYWQNFLNSSLWMEASYAKVYSQNEWWRSWSTLFAHADQKHLLSNSFLFFILGYFLFGHFGFWIFPSMAIFFGGITNLLILKKSAPHVGVIGASGIVFWMGGVWLTLYFLLDRTRSVFQRTLRSFGVTLMLFVPSEAFDPSISYRSHFMGFTLGVLFALVYYWIRRDEFLSAEIYEPLEDPENIACPNFDTVGNCPGSPKSGIEHSSNS